jgi:hypothetical protein
MNNLEYALDKVYSESDIPHLKRIRDAPKDHVVFNDRSETISFLFKRMRGHRTILPVGIHFDSERSPDSHLDIKYHKSVPLEPRKPETRPQFLLPYKPQK